METKRYFRFDDVSINSNMDITNKMAEFLMSKFPACEVIFGISPLVHNMQDEKDQQSKERVFPSLLSAFSDYKNFYKVTKFGLPDMIKGITTASHGLVHIDHRLLPRDVQEMSIMISCSLTNSKIFVPPFNKWNKDTESVCNEHKIELIKFEDGWRSMEHNEYNEVQKLWYLHARAFALEKFISWFE